MIFGQPIERVVDEEVPDRPAVNSVKVDGAAPGSVVAIGEKLRRVGVEIISLRPKVVIDHIQKDHHATRMSALNEFLEMLGTSVSAIRSEWVYTVVAPISSAGEIRYRHQLQRGNT